MKRIICLLLLIVPLMAVPEAGARKLSKKEILAASIARNMKDKNLNFVMTNVISDMGSTPYSEGLPVTLVDGKFSCNLPFVGDSRISTYGSQDLYIKADKAPVEVRSEFNDKKNYYKLEFSFKSPYDNEVFEVQMKVFTNGKTTIRIDSSKRSTMNYSGGMVIK